MRIRNTNRTLKCETGLEGTLPRHEPIDDHSDHTIKRFKWSRQRKKAAQNGRTSE